MNKISALAAAEAASTAARFTKDAINDIFRAIADLEANHAVPLSAVSAIRDACDRAGGYALANCATCDSWVFLEKNARR